MQVEYAFARCPLIEEKMFMYHLGSAGATWSGIYIRYLTLKKFFYLDLLEKSNCIIRKSMQKYKIM